MNIWAALGLVLGGGILRILLPYLREWIKSKAKFDWRMIVGATITLIISMFPVVLVGPVLAELQTMTIPGLLVWGWGFSDLGREVQKGYDTWRSLK